MEKQIFESIKENSIFKNANLEKIDETKVVGSLITIKEGHFIFKEGSEPTDFYIIISGEVNLSFSEKQQNSLLLSQNDFFGHHEIINNTQRISSAIALRDSYLIRLSKDVFDYLYNIDEAIKENCLIKDEIEIDESTEEKIFDDSDIEEDFISSEPPQIDNDDIKTNEYIDKYETTDEISEEEHGITKDLIENTDYDEADQFGGEGPLSEEELARVGLNENTESENEEPDISFSNDSMEIDEDILSSELDEIDLDKEETSEIDTETYEKEMEATEASKSSDGLTHEQLEKIIKAAEIVNSKLNIDDVLNNIVNSAVELTSADRGTLYILDKEENKLWSKITLGDEIQEFSLEIGEGIAGWVAETGEIANIKDVSTDPRFNQNVDNSSGYQTNNMLCFPITNREKEIVGVLQLLNSKNGEFNSTDEEILKHFSINSALALENSRLLEELLSKERVSSLGKMANFLLQDIKKPILVCKRYSEHLLNKEISDDVKKIVNMLQDQINGISELVLTTSSYAEATSILRTTNTSLNKTLDDFISRIQGYLKENNTSIKKDFGPDFNVKVDIKQFFQAFFNIIKNSTEALDGSGEIELTTLCDGDTAQILIADKGMGIPQELIGKVFEPFASFGKKNHTGLGLTISKKVIEELNGSIDIESTNNVGTTVTVNLPVYKVYE